MILQGLPLHCICPLEDSSLQASTTSHLKPHDCAGLTASLHLPSGGQQPAAVLYAAQTLSIKLWSFISYIMAVQDLRLHCTCPVEDSSLQALGTLSQLTRLTVHAYERRLGTATLEHLKGLQQLQVGLHQCIAQSIKHARACGAWRPSSREHLRGLQQLEVGLRTMRVEGLTERMLKYNQTSKRSSDALPCV